MSKLVYKLIAFSIAFFIIFNLNSISYAHTYNNNENIITINTQNTQGLTITTNYETIKISESIDSQVEKVFFSLPQAFLGGLYSILLYPISFILSIIIVAIVGQTIFTIFQISPSSLSSSSGDFLVLIFSSLVFVLTNSFLIYSLDKSKKEHNYFKTLLGSFIGLFLYAGITFGLVVAESLFIPDSKNAFITNNQLAFEVLIMPFFVSCIATLFHYWDMNGIDSNIKLDNEELSFGLEKQKEALLQLTKKVYTSKLKIGKSSFTYNVLKF